MLRTLFGRLVTFLLVLFALIASSYVLLTVFTTRRYIQELHACPIEARSTPGRGTTLAFGLPVARSVAAP